MVRRVRTHANPMKLFPGLEPPDWKEIYADSSKPFDLEIGTSKGEFLLEYSEKHPERNILGVEVREPLVLHLQKKIDSVGRDNAWVIFGNILGRLDEFTPTGRIENLFLFFPDPWPKKRHHKRRVLGLKLVHEIAPLMPPGGAIHFMTDHVQLFDETVAEMKRQEMFEDDGDVSLLAKSQWQKFCEKTQRPFRSTCYRRTALPSGSDGP